MQAKELITDNLLLIVRKLTKENIDVQVSISERSENGDYYTNVALRLSSILKKKPLDIAYQIKSELEKVSDFASIVSKVDVAPPGFVNFYLSEEYLVDTLDYINKEQDKFGTSENLKDQKIMVEFTDPNPFKEFHIGHLYSNVVGESIARLFESQGAIVKRACYQGDVGLHVAKAIYGMQKLVDQMPDQSSSLAVHAQFLGRAYARGSKDYDSNENIKSEINILNKKIYEKDDSIKKLYDLGRKWSLEYYDSIYARLGTHFDYFYFESEVDKEGARIVRENIKNKIFEKSEGAVIFSGEKYGLHNRVFINSLGLPTYEAKDLGLAPTKYKDFPYDRSIILTGNEQTEYFKVVIAALSKINPDLASKVTHIGHGMVLLPGGKISSRTGDVITGDWLMDEAVAQISREFSDMSESTAEKVGIAAIKYALLKNTIGKNMEFNFDESIALTGASGPYLLYAFVRTQSVLEKSQIADAENKKQPINTEERELLRHLVHFPEVISSAGVRLSPSLVAEYLFELSQKFNFFYQKHKIADSSFRLQLTSSVGQALKTGLSLLGIETVERM